jgi:hypothetical protein
LVEEVVLRGGQPEGFDGDLAAVEFVGVAEVD